MRELRKSLKSKEFRARSNKVIKTNRIQFENHENNENHKILREKHENHKNL